VEYSAAVEYLFSQLPMFQRVGAAAYKADLSTTIKLCELLGNPQHGFKSIHVAGTNGKGSVSSALASIFQACGYKTGLFTSPHLKDFRERIRINGDMISKEKVAKFVARYQEIAPDLEPSFFEMTCVMAFEHFKEEKVDIAILETGMGGRLDSTNVVSPEFSIITSIGLDHQQFLGDTKEKIAREKAGIIKENRPILLGKNNREVQSVITEMAAVKNAPYVYAEYGFQPLATDLPGSYQFENMQTVRAAVEIARSIGWNLLESSVLLGATQVLKTTGLRGRWEQIQELPKVILDVGHNEDGVKWVVDMLRQETYVRLHIVWGMVADKDAKTILMQLPISATYYWCRADIPRAKDAQQLSDEALKFSLEGKVYPSVMQAFEAAKAEAQLSDLIFVGGSIFTVAEVL